MHELILEAIRANTAAVQALHQHLHSQLVSKEDLRVFGLGITGALDKLTKEVHERNSKDHQAMAAKLDKAGTSLAEAVANNQPVG